MENNYDPIKMQEAARREQQKKQGYFDGRFKPKQEEPKNKYNRRRFKDKRFW